MKNSDDSPPVSSSAAARKNGAAKQTVALTGKKFADLVRQKKIHGWKGRLVRGDVNLAGASIEDPLILKDVIFSGKVDFSECRFERGVNLTECHFEGGLILKDARIEGPLILDKVVIGTWTEPRTEPIPDPAMIQRIITNLEEGCPRARLDFSEPRDERIRKARLRSRRQTSQRCWGEKLKSVQRSKPQSVADFTNLRVAGCLSMMEATVFGGLSCNHAEIEDDLRIDQAQIHGDLLLRRTSLGEVCTDWMTRHSDADTTVECRVDGKFDLTSTKVAGDVRLVGATIGGQLTMQATDIDGNLLCRASDHLRTRLRNGAWLLGIRVKGTVDFGGALLYGELELSTADIGGNLSCSSYARSKNSQKQEKRPSKCFLTMGGDVRVDAAKIAGNVSFEGASVKGRLSLQNISVGGNIFCRTTQYSGKNPRCKIAKDAWLLGAEVAGNVDISGARIGGQLMMQNAKVGQNLLAMVMEGLPTQVEGDAYLNGIGISGLAYFPGATLQGELYLDGAKIEGDVSFGGASVKGRLSLQNISVGGTLFCTAATHLDKNLPCKIAKDAWLLGAEVAGDVDISGARIGGQLMMQNAKVGQNLLARTMSGLRPWIGGDAWLLGVTVAGAVDLCGVHIGRRLIMEGAEVGSIIARVMGGFPTQIEKNAHLNGVRISGSAEFLGSTLQRDLVLDGASIDGDLMMAFDFDDEKNWKVKHSRIGGGIHAESAKIGKRVILAGLHVDSKEKHGVDFAGAQIHGDFLLYSKGLVSEHLQSKKAGGLAKEISAGRKKKLLEQPLRERTTIQGDLRLTLAQVRGDIVLDGCTVKGKLDLRGANLQANINCRPIDPSGEPVRASVYEADFETLETIGNIDLTGLDIGEPNNKGDLNLRDARIRGRLELHTSQERETQPTVEHKTNIKGDLCMNAAEVSRVIVSGASFGENPLPEANQEEGAAWLARKVEKWATRWTRIKKQLLRASNRVKKDRERKVGIVRHHCSVVMYLLKGGDPKEDKPASERCIVLERAKIGRLDIIDPLPGKVDLSDLQVGSWEKADRDADYFPRMLECSHPFKKSNYIAIEEDLRNKSMDDEADKVHVLMRQRNRIYTESFWRVIGNRVLDHLVKYGTNSKRLFWIMAAIFVLSLATFSIPSNVEYKIIPSTESSSMVENPGEGTTKALPIIHPKKWNIWNGAFLAVRLHIPIISLGIDEEFQPSGTRAKTYAMVIVGASWLVWPLFIASASGLLRKRS